MASLPKNKLATTSLTLGLVGWGLYLLQWCFDLTLGLLLSVLTAGTSAVCATVLDVLPFALWIAGIVTGHMALGQIKQSSAPGHSQAAWGLALNYLGLFFTIIFTIVVILLVTAGVGVGVLDKIIPSLHK